MKRFVDIEFKILLVTGIVLFVLILLTEPLTALLLLLAFGFVSVAVKVEESPPRWLLRSPLGGWVRRYSERRR